MAYALFNDNFNRPDENPLALAWAGGYTSNSVNDLQLLSNVIRMVANTGGKDAYNAYTISPGNDQWAKCTLATLTAGYSQAGTIGRATAPTSISCYMAVGSTGPGSDLREVAAGVGASLVSDATSWAANDNVVLAMRGTSLYLYKNGGVPLLTTTDATLTSGRIGLTAYADTISQAEADNWTGGTLPITLVAAGTEGDVASGNCTPGLPAGIARNDILICVAHSTDQVSHSMTADWTQIVQGNGGGTTSHLSVWWHRYDGITSPSATITHSAGSALIAGVAAFRGCKAGGSPVNVAGTINGGTDASIEHNGVTVTVDACMLLACNGSADDNTRTLLSGWTNIFEDTAASTQNAFIGTLASGSPDESVSAFYIDTFIGSTGTVTVTQSASDAWASALVALEPEDNLMGQTVLVYF